MRVLRSEIVDQVDRVDAFLDGSAHRAVVTPSPIVVDDKVVVGHDLDGDLRVAGWEIRGGSMKPARWTGGSRPGLAARAITG